MNFSYRILRKPDTAIVIAMTLWQSMWLEDWPRVFKRKQVALESSRSYSMRLWCNREYHMNGIGA